MMAVRKATRSNPSAQPPQPVRHRPDHQLKAEIFETLRHLNRGYGVALAAFDKLEAKDRLHRSRAFPVGFLHDYRNRTEALRALTNRDLPRLIVEREDQEAERFGRLSPDAPTRKRR